MRKTLLLLLAAMLLPLSALALDLQPNQLILGHYTTDSIALGGCWGKSIIRGTRPIATDLTPDELALFQGSTIKAFRVGLSLSTDVTRVFVIPVAPDGTLGEETEWPCAVSDAGWNLVELETPYLINLPSDYSLRIGFDYDQVGSAKPISAVKVGTIYPSYCYYKDKWQDYGINLHGNLSLQLICENDNFPSYIIRIKNLTNKSKVKVGDDLNFSFQACSLGTQQIAPGNLTFDVAIDGTVVKTISNPVTLGWEYMTISDVINTADLAEGAHMLTVTTTTLNGEPVESPSYLVSTFACFTNGFSRQMRLVEQFTSTGCQWCPTGSRALQALCDMRGDIAWVGVHVLFGSPVDPFTSAQNDSIANYEHCTGYPTGSFDRVAGIEEAGEVCGVLSYTSASGGAHVFNTFLESIDDPSWATININSTFDSEARKAEITISGELVPKFDDMMGGESKLTVYITEDGLVATQNDQGTNISNYVHNGVLRFVPSGVKGVNIKKNGNTYKNVFTVNIPNNWNPENLNVVAFISRPLGGPLTDLAVNQANKRKLGEYDEPTIIPGDVDSDGFITISDLTTLIDLLLSGNEAPEGADVDGDGEITISDVTTLIDMLLNGNN